MIIPIELVNWAITSQFLASVKKQKYQGYLFTCRRAAQFRVAERVCDDCEEFLG
jgi:hypothetical protein